MQNKASECSNAKTTWYAAGLVYAWHFVCINKSCISIKLFTGI